MDEKREKHSRVVAGVREFWWTENLWAAAAGLPVTSVRIDGLTEVDAVRFEVDPAPDWTVPVSR